MAMSEEVKRSLSSVSQSAKSLTAQLSTVVGTKVLLPPETGRPVHTWMAEKKLTRISLMREPAAFCNFLSAPNQPTYTPKKPWMHFGLVPSPVFYLVCDCACFSVVQEWPAKDSVYDYYFGHVEYSACQSLGYCPVLRFPLFRGFTAFAQNYVRCQCFVLNCRRCRCSPWNSFFLGNVNCMNMKSSNIVPFNTLGGGGGGGVTSYSYVNWRGYISAHSYRGTTMQGIKFATIECSRRGTD